MKHMFVDRKDAGPCPDLKDQNDHVELHTIAKRLSTQTSNYARMAEGSQKEALEDVSAKAWQLVLAMRRMSAEKIDFKALDDKLYEDTSKGDG